MKIIKKSCTTCGLEAAVARKVCIGCNKPFIKKSTIFKVENSALGTDDANNTACNGMARKWPERIMRGKPHFYDAADFQIIGKKKKRGRRKKRKSPSVSSNSSSSSYLSSSSSATSVITPSSAYWGLSIWKHPKPSLTAELRKKCNKYDKRPSEVKDFDDVFGDSFDYADSPLRPEQMSLILEELNYKFRITTWRA